MAFKQEKTAVGSAEIRSRHQANRKAWNEGAQVYSASNDERVASLKAGNSNLHPVERANLAPFGDLQKWCQRAIHLQCASGNDTLSLILEGAHEVVGVDISDVHIANARWTSEQLGMAAQWFCCDILDTPDELNGTADLVYTGRGAICWLHDIDAWAKVVARLLKKGGVLSLYDDHPASWLFELDSTEIEASKLNYFNYAESNQGWPEAYIGDLDKASTEHAVKHERLWPLATVFQALVSAGLTVTYLGEHPEQYWPAFPNLSDEDRAKMPNTFSIIARKE